MTIIDALIPGKPLSALPNVTFAAYLVYYRHPPVPENKDQQADNPLDDDPKEINPSEQNSP